MALFCLAFIQLMWDRLLRENAQGRTFLKFPGRLADPRSRDDFFVCDVERTVIIQARLISCRSGTSNHFRRGRKKSFFPPPDISIRASVLNKEYK